MSASYDTPAKGAIYDGAPYVVPQGITTQGGSSAVTFNLADYDIDARAEGDALYLPFATVDALFANHLMDNARVAEGAVHVETMRDFLDQTDVSADEEGAGGTVLVDGDAARPADLAESAYGNLCFAVDKFYGQPGRELLHDQLEDGLDAALDRYGEFGQQVKELLKSTSNEDYAAGLCGLSNLLVDGAHTAISPSFTFGGEPLLMPSEEKYPEMAEAMKQAMLTSMAMGVDEDAVAVKEAHSQAYETGQTYVKQGDTAICVLNSFMFSGGTFADIWEGVYGLKGADGTPALPEAVKVADDRATVVEPAVVVYEALEQARQDPEIENFVIDVSCNGGGSLDPAIAIIALVTGKADVQAHYINKLTGQNITASYKVDRNFDGVVDEHDEDVQYDFNFAVLTSGNSWSCGNLFPSLMRDAGYPVIGMQSAGGTCCVRPLNTADGQSFVISSAMGALATKDFETIDEGVPVDVELMPADTVDADAIRGAVEEAYALPAAA